jgi:hypothetical protein
LFPELPSARHSQASESTELKSVDAIGYFSSSTSAAVETSGLVLPDWNRLRALRSMPGPPLTSWST